jgi:hypothetical protein
MARWWAKPAAAVKLWHFPAQNDKDAAPPALAVAAVAYAATIGCSRFTAVWNQVIPSSTAVIAAPRTAIVAANTVTAAANHRSSRSRRSRGTRTRGKAEGIAGRISMRIVDAPSRDAAQKYPRRD